MQYCTSTNSGFSFTARNQSPVNLSTIVVPTVRYTLYAPLTPFAAVNRTHRKHTTRGISSADARSGRYEGCISGIKHQRQSQTWHFWVERRTPPPHTTKTPTNTRRTPYGSLLSNAQRVQMPLCRQKMAASPLARWLFHLKCQSKSGSPGSCLEPSEGGWGWGLSWCSLKHQRL